MKDKSIWVRDAVLQAQVEASLGGHDLSPFMQDSNGWQAYCIECLDYVHIRPNGDVNNQLSNTCSPIDPGPQTAIF